MIVEGPAVGLKQEHSNLAAVRTNHPKISQLTLAAIIEREFPSYQVELIDLKAKNPAKEIKIKEIGYGDQRVEVYGVGEEFATIEKKIQQAGVIILTNNFTQEAGILGDFITFCKEVNPQGKVLVGGSDASIKTKEVNRQEYFLSRGADYVAPLGDGELLLPRVLQGEFISGKEFLTDFNRVPDLPLHLVDLKQYTESPEGPLPPGIKPPLLYVETSRGCRQSCDFCSTPFTKGQYRYWSTERIKQALRYYKDAGINTLLLCEDNILSRLDYPSGRKDILDWFRYMREENFCWEFANGVEIGKLADNNRPDQELIEHLFKYEGTTGCYRCYVPLERVDKVAYRKLRPYDQEKEIIAFIIQQGTPLLNFGVIIGSPSETVESLLVTEVKMREIMDQTKQQSSGKTLPYANVFVHIPIPGTNDFRKFQKRLIVDINEHPELFNFSTSVIAGEALSCYDVTKRRKELAIKLNGEEAVEIWEKVGKYVPIPSGLN